jgi:putative ABC transport system substrate-binding protein
MPFIPKRKINRIIFSFLGLLYLLFLLFTNAAKAVAADVLLLTSGNMQPYNQAAQAALDTLQSGPAVTGPKSFFAVSVEKIVMHPDTEGKTAVELQRLKPTIILAIGSRALGQALQIDDAVVVYVLAPGAEKKIVKESQTITGVIMHPEPVDVLRNIRKALPNVHRLGVLFHPQFSGEMIRKAQSAAAEEELVLITVPVQSAKQVASSLASMKETVDALWMIPDPYVLNSQTIKAFLHYSVTYHLPLISFAEKYLDIGASIVVAASVDTMGRQAAQMVLQILRGGNSAVMEPRYPGQVEVLYNHSLLKRLGIPVNAAGVKQ